MRASFLAAWVAITLPCTVAAQQPVHPPLTLAQAMALGRERGIAAVLARLNLDAARRRVAQRRGDLLPLITAGASITQQTLNLDEFGIPVATGVTDPFTLYNLQVRASQTVFDASLISRLHAATDSAAAAGYDARAVGGFAAATAGFAYLRVLGVEETVRARLQDSIVATTLLDAARRQFNAGVSPVIDVTRNEVNLAGVLTQLVVARNLADRARLDLARALDLPPGSRIELADSLTAAALDIPASTEEAIAFARTHRAEILAEDQRTRAVSRSVRAIWNENLPTLAVSGRYAWSGRETGSLKDTYLLQVQLTVPILDGFKRQNRHREGEIRLESQLVHQHDVATQVETEVRQAFLDLASATRQVDLTVERLRLAELELTQAEERFRAGVTGSVETTTAQGTVIFARDGQIQARLNLASARVSAYRALGVLEDVR